MITILNHLIHLIIQPNFQACLGVDVEASPQKASKLTCKHLTSYCFLNCTDAKGREIWVVTEANRDQKPIKRKNIGKRSLATGDGVYTLTFQYYLIITSFFPSGNSSKYVSQGKKCSIY